MNPFCLTWMVFFTLYCSSQSKPSNTDSEDTSMIRCDTLMQFHQIKYLWTIHQFSHHEALNTSELLSPKLHASTTDKYEWDIVIKPNHIDEGKKTIAVFVYLSGGSTIKEASEYFNVSIINHKKETLFSRNQTQIKHEAGVAWGWGDYCEKDDFFRHHLLQNDTLTLQIYIKWFTQLCNNVSHEPETTTTLLNRSDSFESYVVFATNGGNYLARKDILAARSPIFAAMIQRKDTKNGKNKTIRINATQTNEEVLQAMLQYINTGECGNLVKLADKLFIAAAKYGLEGLRKMCEQTLCMALSTKNAVKMLVFAEKHHANELKFKAARFIAYSSAQKLNTTG
ncbi:speckle-type POZ protein-like [Planococcus citri]|uniref:speckle-type POZ protein-like n=1 Tax=Planococcus citri TaxID=170843 RepID=UPI0031F91981